jgi:hypothetical protein
VQGSRVLGVAHAVLSGLAGVYALVTLPMALLDGRFLVGVALACVAAAGVAVVRGVLRSHRGALRVACLLYGAAALLLVGQDAFIPAAAAAMLFVVTVAVTLRAAPPKQEGAPPQP